LNAHARTYYIIGVVIGLILLFTGCEEPVETTYLTIPIQFSLPSSSVEPMYAPERAFADSCLDEEFPSRIYGDPGTYLEFVRPTHATVFMVYFRDETLEPRVLISVLDTTLNPSRWQLTHSIAGDSIYTYADQFNFALIGDTKEHIDSAHVYMVVSNTSLTLKNGDNTITTSPKAYWPTTEAEVQSVKFTVDNDMQSNIQHVYSSPAKLKSGVHYYGHLDNFSANVPRIDLLLYHVASKVDIMWNVPIDKHSELCVTKVKAKNLFEGDAYLFKPTETPHTKFTNSDGYTPTADLAGNAAGTWWSGRNYFYTMAYQATDLSNKFPIQLEIEVKGLTPSYDPRVFNITLQKGSLGVFTPWMRGQFTISRIPDRAVEDVEKNI